MRKVYCEELIERLVNYMMSMWMYDYQRADRKIVKKEIKEIMEEFENGKVGKILFGGKKVVNPYNKRLKTSTNVTKGEMRIKEDLNEKGTETKKES